MTAAGYADLLGKVTAADWLVADALGAEEIHPGVWSLVEAPVLDSAMLAAVGAGIYEDIPDAAVNMVHTERTIEPEEEAHEEYKLYVDRYFEKYPAMRGLMHKTAEHLSG